MKDKTSNRHKADKQKVLSIYWSKIGSIKRYFCLQKTIIRLWAQKRFNHSRLNCLYCNKLLSFRKSGNTCIKTFHVISRMFSAIRMVSSILPRLIGSKKIVLVKTRCFPNMSNTYYMYLFRRECRIESSEKPANIPNKYYLKNSRKGSTGRNLS